MTEETQEESDNSTEGNLLTAIEARVLGTLMEKHLTTPDAYPLTVNSLIIGCNQKTSREPVSNYQQGEVVRTLRELETRRFIKYEMGARSDRYAQGLTTELGLSRKQQALLCVMMLRGPQTVAELLTRTQRMDVFADREELMVSLERLTQGESPQVVCVPTTSGKREDRYGHLFCGVPEIQTSSSDTSAARTVDSDALTDLRAEVLQLRKELDELYKLTGHAKVSSDEAEPEPSVD